MYNNINTWFKLLKQQLIELGFAYATTVHRKKAKELVHSRVVFYTTEPRLNPKI
jgi:hypothetical protein